MSNTLEQLWQEMQRELEQKARERDLIRYDESIWCTFEITPRFGAKNEEILALHVGEFFTYERFLSTLSGSENPAREKRIRRSAATRARNVILLNRERGGTYPTKQYETVGEFWNFCCRNPKDAKNFTHAGPLTWSVIQTALKEVGLEFPPEVFAQLKK